MRRFCTGLGCAAIACAVIGLTLGCSSGPKKMGPAVKAGAKAQEGMMETRDLLATGREQLGTTVAGLRSMAFQPTGDPVAQIKEYSSNLAELEKTAQRFRDHSTKMQARGEEYFDAWETEIAAINNTSLQETGSQRLARVRGHLANFRTKAEETREIYTPLMADMLDLQRFLANDPSQEAVASIRELVVEIEREAERVEDGLTSLISTLDAAVEAMGRGQPA